LFVCKCVDCHRLSTQLQLTNISCHIYRFVKNRPPSAKMFFTFSFPADEQRNIFLKQAMNFSFHITCSFSSLNHSNIGPRHINICKYSWFQTSVVRWTLYSFFWVIPGCLNFMCRCFRTPCLSIFIGRVNISSCSNTVPRKRMSGYKNTLPLYAFIARKGTGLLLLLISDVYHILVTDVSNTFRRQATDG